MGGHFRKSLHVHVDEVFGRHKPLGRSPRRSEHRINDDAIATLALADLLALSGDKETLNETPKGRVSASPPAAPRGGAPFR